MYIYLNFACAVTFPKKHSFDMGLYTRESGLLSGVARGGGLGAVGPGRHFKGGGTLMTKK